MNEATLKMNEAKIIEYSKTWNIVPLAIPTATGLYRISLGFRSEIIRETENNVGEIRLNTNISI